MSKGGGKFQRKKEYFTKLSNLLVDYKKVLIVAANNVGSNQLQRVRQELRGKAVLLMGKNVRCVALRALHLFFRIQQTSHECSWRASSHHWCEHRPTNRP